MDEVLIVDHQVDVSRAPPSPERPLRLLTKAIGRSLRRSPMVKAEIESVRLSPLLDREPGIDHLLSIAAR